jgi:hypothetical protein
MNTLANTANSAPWMHKKNKPKKDQVLPGNQETIRPVNIMRQ